MVLELPFNDEEDAATEGNAPYDSIVNGVPYDLEDYWTQVYPELTEGQAWTPLATAAAVRPVEPADVRRPVDRGLLAVLLRARRLRRLGQRRTPCPRSTAEGGDYAVATLLATQWGLAALNRLGDESDEKTSTARGDCLAGAYTASVILYNREATSTYHISPGDLDEGIKALLLFRGDGDVDRQGAGFDRTRAFREGVIDGAQACLSYSRPNLTPAGARPPCAALTDPGRDGPSNVGGPLTPRRCRRAARATSRRHRARCG